jgi:hypothetical protein
MQRKKSDTLIYDQRVVVAWTGQFRSRFNELPICTSRECSFWVSHGSQSAQDCARFREVRRWAVVTAGNGTNAAYEFLNEPQGLSQRCIAPVVLCVTQPDLNQHVLGQHHQGSVSGGPTHRDIDQASHPGRDWSCC